MGATHGGVLFLLADTAAGLAFLALLAEGESGTTVEIKNKFPATRVEYCSVPKPTSSNMETR